MSKLLVVLGTIVFAGALSYLGFVCSVLLFADIGDLDSSMPCTTKAALVAGSILPPAAGLGLVVLGRGPAKAASGSRACRDACPFE